MEFAFNFTLDSTRMSYHSPRGIAREGVRRLTELDDVETRYPMEPTGGGSLAREMPKGASCVGHIDRSRSPATPTDKMDCRHFHALSGRKRAAFLVSCPLRLLCAERSARATTRTLRSLSSSD